MFGCTVVDKSEINHLSLAVTTKTSQDNVYISGH